MLYRLILAALLAGLSSHAEAQVPQVVPTCGASSGMAMQVGPGGRLTVSPDGTLCTVAPSGGGNTTGSVTPAGTNGTSAQAVQGINGGVPVLTTTAPSAGSQEQDVRLAGTLDAATVGSSIVIPINGQATVGLRFSGLAASGATLAYEQSNDGGTTYTAVNETNTATGVPSATRTADGQVRVAAAGHTNIRLRVSVAGTGSISVFYTVSVRPFGTALTAPLPPGANTVGSIANTAFGINGPIPAGANVIGAVTQSGGPWSVSGTVTANLGTLNGAATAAKQPALGTAGTSSADVLSIQGIAGGVAQNITGTVTANLGALNGAATAANQPSVQTAGSAAAGTGLRVMGNDGAAMRDVLTTTTGALEPPTAASAAKITRTSTAVAANTSTTIAAANAARISYGVQCATGAVSVDETGAALTAAAVGNGTLFIPTGTAPYFTPPVATRTAITAYTATAQTCVVTEYLR